MNGYARKPFSEDANFEFTGQAEPIDVLPDIGRREAERSGPGTAARRTLEALAESRRLRKELAALDSYEDL
ncbi:MAG: PA3496 family putative envelope integrity protein [Gammaproteobacteria bacterium]